MPLEMVELEWVEDDPQGLDDGHWFPNEVAFRGRSRSTPRSRSAPTPRRRSSEARTAADHVEGHALVVGAVAAGCTLVTFVPQEKAVAETPFIVEGEVGETLDLTYAELTVTEVRVADTVTSFSEAAAAGGTFIVVDATWRATQGETTFSGAEVTDAAGPQVLADQRGGCAAVGSAQPG